MSSYQGNILIKNPAAPTGPAETGSAPGIWKLNEALAFKRQGIWPTQGVPASDTYFPYVSLLLSTTALGNANNNLFVDSSGAFNPISRNGNTTQGSVTPYSASWSNYFDGTSDWLSLDDSAAWDFGTGDFTIECWVYPQSSANDQAYISNYQNSGSGWLLGTDSSGTRFSWGDTSIFSNATRPTLNQWNHLAVSRSGTSLRVFLNGTQLGSTVTNSTSLTNNAGIRIGRLADGGLAIWYFTGYLSNLRVVKGTAVYTANFTVPTTPLTAIANTQLLTCQSNRFRDASTNNFTITRNGDVTVTDFSPFAPASPGIVYNQSDITNWSGYFDGTGDYLQIPNNAALGVPTGDFTFETWVYPTALTGQNYTPVAVYAINNVSTAADLAYACIIKSNNTVEFSVYVGSTAYRATSTSTLSTNTWTHIAGVRSGNTLTLYLNGTSAATVTISGAINDGTSALYRIGGYQETSTFYYFKGYISNQRFVKGTAVYTSNFTPPTSPLTAISGTSLLTLQNAAFTDNSANNFVVTINGNTTVTGNSPFNPVGYWSLYGPSTAGATIPQTTATDLGSGSFTVECWVNISDYSGNSILTKRRTDTALTGSWGIFLDASGFMNFQGVGWASSYTATTDVVPRNRWTHLAVSRSGTNLSMFVNGVRVYNVTDSYNYTCSTYTIIKLGGNSGGNYPSGTALRFGFDGAISNVRIVQGAAVYDPASTSFTVPTSPLTAVSGTSLLTCQNGTMKDNSANNNTSILLYNSAAAIQPFNPFYTSTIASNGGSMYFDGSGDYLTVPYAANMRYAGDFTIECWVNPTARLRLYPCIVSNYSTFASNGGFSIFAGHNSSSATKYQVAFNGSFPFIQSTSDIIYGAWAHIALVRVGSTITLYINGVANGTGTSSATVVGTANSWWVGVTGDSLTDGAFNGYINGLRATPSAVYTAAFTPPTAPLTPSANTTLLLNGMNAGIYDATAINNMETVGNAQVSTAVSKFGGSSVAFDGTGDYLTSNALSDLYAFGTGDFTIEMWFNLSSFASLQILYDSRPTSTDGLYPLIYVASGGGSVIWQISAVARITGTATLSTGVWYHVAVSRSSGSTKMFLNGTQIGSTYADTNAYLNSGTTRPFIGGSSYTAGTLTVNGYIDDFRITKGVARYTTNFTPPTQAFLPY